MKQRLAILGSTGSIGVQTLDIVRETPSLFEVRVLTANRNWQRLAAQAREFDADTAVIADERYYGQLRDALAGTDVKVYAGEDAVAQVAAGGDTDVVVNALVGYAGLAPTVAALGAGKKLALANKESLVVGGEYVMRLAAEKRAPILPIDSEHSAIFQCLVGEQSPIRRLIITCSGGAFRDLPCEKLADVTVEQALRHPQWEMGAKITIDSSTLVNKGFEVIEAHWLFGTPVEKITVLLHPQSIVHSMVEFEDGAIKAQLGTPDMRMPISFALMYPRRATRPGERFDFMAHPQLTFAGVDRAKYPALEIACECLRRRGCKVVALPAYTPAGEVLSGGFDGVMLSNGPGDPEENTEIIAELRKLYDSTIPIFGVCMGHQLLALATGAKTGRLAYGHRGGNHPVRDLEKNRVFITSQNHGYMVLSDTVDPAVAEVSHINVNDDTCEGLRYKRPNCFTTQFHPEANAGPKDTEYLFNRFIDSMGGAK